jgi:hypothetical protein
MKIGRKIYYDKLTGNVILTTSEMQGSVVETTLEQDVSTFEELNGRIAGTFDFVQLAYGEFAHDFTECNGYRVNVETKELEFSYPDPTQPDVPPVYQKPLSEKVIELEERQSLMQQALDEILLGGM